MFKRRFRLPSPALVISLVALSLVLGGTAVAASTAKHKDVKADTKLVKKLAPSLSVKHAKTANSATTAASAANATHATSADSATNATHATSADSATNATNATTAANASALGGVGASNYVQNNGNIYVQLGHSNWAPFHSNDPVVVTHFTNVQGMVSSSTGSFAFRIDGGVPTSLYGKALALSGVQICYDATSGPSITDVYVETDTEATSGIGTIAVLDHDATARTDAACRTYNPSSPVTLTSQTQISIYLVASWGTAGQTLDLGRVTAILQPTSAAATMPKAAAQGGKAPGALSPASH